MNRFKYTFMLEIIYVIVNYSRYIVHRLIKINTYLENISASMKFLLYKNKIIHLKNIALNSSNIHKKHNMQSIQQYDHIIIKTKELLFANILLLKNNYNKIAALSYLLLCYLLNKYTSVFSLVCTNNLKDIY